MDWEVVWGLIVLVFTFVFLYVAAEDLFKGRRRRW